jgi:adenine phosphoribosyltransferase
VTLLRKMGAEVVECCFIIDLPDVGGRKRLKKLGVKVFVLCEFEGE